MKFLSVLVYFVLLLLCLIPNLLPNLIGGLLGTEPPNIGDVSLLFLLLVHLGLVLLAEAVVLLIGVPLAIIVTRTGRKAWMRLAEALAGLGQTVPTLAILALAVPTLGLGAVRFDACGFQWHSGLG
jgi:osmoprotectant transport system permease protein